MPLTNARDDARVAKAVGYNHRFPGMTVPDAMKLADFRKKSSSVQSMMMTMTRTMTRTMTTASTNWRTIMMIRMTTMMRTRKDDYYEFYNLSSVIHP